MWCNRGKFFGPETPAQHPPLNLVQETRTGRLSNKSTNYVITLDNYKTTATFVLLL